MENWDKTGEEAGAGQPLGTNPSCPRDQALWFVTRSYPFTLPAPLGASRGFSLSPPPACSTSPFFIFFFLYLLSLCPTSLSSLPSLSLFLLLIIIY